MNRMAKYWTAAMMVSAMLASGSAGAQIHVRRAAVLGNPDYPYDNAYNPRTFGIYGYPYQYSYVYNYGYPYGYTYPNAYTYDYTNPFGWIAAVTAPLTTLGPHP